MKSRKKFQPPRSGYHDILDVPDSEEENDNDAGGGKE